MGMWGGGGGESIVTSKFHWGVNVESLIPQNRCGLACNIWPPGDKLYPLKP